MYLCGHWKRSPVCAVKASSGHKAVKIMSTLLVSCRAKGKGSNGSRVHEIVMLLMSSYWPYSIWQCSLQSILRPAMMVLGLILVEIMFLFGHALSQYTIKNTISITILAGSALNDVEL